MFGDGFYASSDVSTHGRIDNDDNDDDVEEDCDSQPTSGRPCHGSGPFNWARSHSMRQ